MCKRVEGSGRNKVVIWTISPPFKKGHPGFVAATSGAGFDGEVHFTDDIWFAMALERDSSKQALTNLRRRTDKALYTHEAIAQLVVAT